MSGIPLKASYGPEDLDVARLDVRGEARRSRPVSVHARPARDDVPRQAVDDAHVRRLRHARGHEQALQVPARERPDRPVDRVRYADADGLRPRPHALARRGRPRGRVGRVARRHDAAVRRHPARQGVDVDDDQRAGGRAARALRRGRREAGRLARQAARHAAERHAQGVHRAEGVDQPDPRPHADHPRHARVVHARRCRSGTRSRSAAITSARPARPACRSSRSRSPTASATCSSASTAGSTSTSSRRACRSSSTSTTTSSRRSRSSAPAAACGPKIMRERFGAKNPKSWLLRTHAQTAGVSLMAQQPLNNVVRTTMQALAAVLGGTQSLHTNSYDETYALPTEDAAELALRTQQVIAEETGVAQRRRSARRQLLRRDADRSGRGRGVGLHPQDRRDGRHRAGRRGRLPAARDRARGVRVPARGRQRPARDRRRQQVRDADEGDNIPTLKIEHEAEQRPDRAREGVPRAARHGRGRARARRGARPRSRTTSRT